MDEGEKKKKENQDWKWKMMKKLVKNEWAESNIMD